MSDVKKAFRTRLDHWRLSFLSIYTYNELYFYRTNLALKLANASGLCLPFCRPPTSTLSWLTCLLGPPFGCDSADVVEDVLEGRKGFLLPEESDGGIVTLRWVCVIGTHDGGIEGDGCDGTDDSIVLGALISWLDG